MLYLFGGVAILSGVLLLGYLFVNANPARLAHTVKWIGIAIGVLVLVALVVLLRGQILEFLLPAALLGIPLWRRLRAKLRP